MSDKDKLTRRDFLKGAGAAAIGTALTWPVLAQDKTAAAGKSKVVLVRHSEALTSAGQPNGAVIQKMLDDAVCALHNVSDPVAAWKKIIKPSDIVGIKTNVWNYLPTTTEVEQAIKRRVMDAGVAEKDIGIDDRGVLDHPVFRRATALINARPMRTHAWSGVGSLIKNYIMFTPEPSSYHDNACASLGALWKLPAVAGKTRLNILVLLTPLFYGIGPHHFDRTYTWPYKGLVVSADPVAADTIGLMIFQAKRKEYFGGDKPIQPSAHHIALAGTKYGLGVSDIKRIDLIKLGWMDGAMI